MLNQMHCHCGKARKEPMLRWVNCFMVLDVVGVLKVQLIQEVHTICNRITTICGMEERGNRVLKW